MRTRKKLPGAAFLLSGALAGCSGTPVKVPTGKQTFETHCAACHGASGEGDGPVAATINVPVPNLRLLSERYGGQFPTDVAMSYIDGRAMPVAHGNRQMPVWGGIFDVTAQVFRGDSSAEQRIEALLAYIEGLQAPAR